MSLGLVLWPGGLLGFPCAVGVLFLRFPFLMGLVVALASESPIGLGFAFCTGAPGWSGYVVFV
jgi:hypothetical protein